MHLLFFAISHKKSHLKVTRNQLPLPSNSNKTASKCSRRFIGLQASHRYFTIPSSAVSLNASSTLHIVNFSVWQNFCLHCSIMHVCNYYYPTHINNNSSNEWPIASIEVQTEPEQKLSPCVDKEINLSMNSVRFLRHKKDAINVPCLHCDFNSHQFIEKGT